MTIHTIALTLNNRELAVLIWLVTFIVYVMRFQSARVIAMGFLKIVLAKYIIRYLAATFIWTTIGVGILHAVGVWKLENLKTTIVCFVAIFFGTMMDISKLEVKRNYLRKTIRDALNFTVIIVFVVGLYSFSLLTELALVPLTGFIAFLVTFSDKKPEHAAVNRVLQSILTIAGFAMLYHAVRSAWSDTSSLISWTNGRDFSVPILLTLWLIPLLMAVKVYLAYNMGAVMLPSAIKHRAMRRYALRRALRVLGPDTESLRGYLTYLHIHKPKSRRDVDHALEQWDLRRIHRYDPPRGPVKDGWTIKFVQQILADEGVIFEEYSPTSPQKWGASSNSIPLCSDDDRSFLWLYMEGTRASVDQIRIEFRMNRGREFLREEARGVAIFKSFCERAFGNLPQSMRTAIRNRKAVKVRQGGLQLSYRRDDYQHSYTAVVVVRLASLTPTFDGL